MTQLTCLDKIVLSYGQAFTGKKGNRTDAHIAHLLSVKVDRVEKSIARLKKLNLCNSPGALGAWAIRTGHGTCRWTEKSTMHRVCRSKIAVRRNLDFPEPVQKFDG